MTPGVPSVEGWEIYSLGDLFEFSNRVNASKSAYGNGIPFANVLEVITNEVLTDGMIPGRVRLPSALVSRYLVRHGDVLFNRTSETQEEVGLSSVYAGASQIVFGGFVLRGRPKTNRLSVDYSAYALRSQRVREQIVARGQGGIRANIGQRDLKTVRVALPPVEEQKRVAGTLGDVDRWIKALTDLIAKRQAVRQGMMQQLLTGRTRLRGFTKPWTSVPFERLAVPTKARKDPRDAPPSTRLIELEHLESGTGQLLGSGSARHSMSLKTAFEPGDVLFGKLRAYLRKFWLAEYAGLCSTEIWAFRVKRGVNSGYVRYLVESDRFIDVASGGYGTHMPRSDWAMVRNLECPLPPLDEQEAIASVLRDVDRELEVDNARLVGAKAVREGIVQQLVNASMRLALATAS